MATRIKHGMERNQTHKLRARYAHTPPISRSVNRIKGLMNFGDANVGQIHGDLSDAEFFDVPTNTLDAFQLARRPNGFTVFIADDFARERAGLALDTAFFAHIKSDGICAARGCRVEVDVVSHQKVACRNRGRARAWLKLTWAKIRSPLWVGEAVFECLVFAFAHICQVLALRTTRGIFIEVDCQTSLFAKAAPKLARVFSRLVHCDA